MASPSTPLLSDQAPSSNPSNSHSQQNSSSNLNHDSENVSLRQRLESLNQLALEHWQSLSSRTKVIYVFLWLFYITLGIGFWVIGPERVFDYTAKLSLLLSRLTYGKPLLTLFVILVSFPPIPGYSTFMSLCGLAFGSSKAKTDLYPHGHSVLEGWILAASSTIIGASISFLVMRSIVNRWGSRNQMIRNFKEDRNWKIMERAVVGKGFYMIVLLRFCPFPFVYSNLFFSSLPSVTFPQFILATIFITPKLFLHVFVGSRLFELMDRDSRIHLDPKTTRLNLVYAVGGILIGAITGWILWRETQRVLKELQEEEDARVGSVEGENGERNVEVVRENEREAERLIAKKVEHKARKSKGRRSLEEGRESGNGEERSNGKGYGSTNSREQT